MKICLVLLYLVCCSSYLTAQAPADRHAFTLTYANDYFTATDYYFTQGVRLAYDVPGRKGHLLSGLLPGWAAGTLNRYSYFLAQDGYTPTSIRADSILRGDRPYAGTLYAGIRRTSVQPDQRWRLATELRVGVIGPWALSGEEQEWIHRQTGNILPRGWQYQIANDLILQYQLTLDRLLWRRNWLAWTGGAHGWLGTYQNRLGLQSRFAAGLFQTDYRVQRRRAVEVAVYLQAQLRLIGYDATLQGGLFNNKSVYTLPGRSIERLTAVAQGGVQLRFGPVLLDFSHTHSTPEFDGARRHAWGTARLGVEW